MLQLANNLTGVYDGAPELFHYKITAWMNCNQENIVMFDIMNILAFFKCEWEK